MIHNWRIICICWFQSTIRAWCCLSIVCRDKRSFFGTLEPINTNGLLSSSRKIRSKIWGQLVWNIFPGVWNYHLGPIILVWFSRLADQQTSFNIALIMCAGINWALQGALYLGCSLNNLSLTRTHGLSNYIDCRISSLKLLGSLYSIGILRSSLNLETVFLVHRSCLTTITGLTYHVDRDTFFCRIFFSRPHHMKEICRPPQIWFRGGGHAWT